MNQHTKVSIIIPVYGTEAYLSRCVDSVLAQSYTNLEVILVDDGSPDNCPRMCDEYAAEDSRVKVIHKQNEGLAIARRNGILVSSGDYIMVVDSDDWIDPETVAGCVDVAVRDDADCVMFSYVREYADRSLQTLLFPERYSYDVEKSESLLHRRIVGPIGDELKSPHQVDSLSSVCMKLYRAEVARRGKIVSERLIGTSDDTMFNLYALENCRISYVNQCFYHYRKSNAQSITTRYKPDLAEKWDVLYGLFEEYVEKSPHAEVYRSAFLNRVACGMIGLGLNEVASPASVFQISRRIRGILQKPLYRQAMQHLDTSACPLKWKVFFSLCRREAAFSLTVLLRLMNYLRSRMAA